jgi:hypothetical protein
MNQWSWNITQNRTKQKTQHIIPLEISHPQDALHYTAHTRQTDREHYSWPYLSRRPGFLKSLPLLRRAMSSVHDRFAVCVQRNGGHLEGVIFRVEWCVVFFVLFCVMFQYHWFTYFCKCKSMYFLINVTVSWYPVLFIFLNTSKSPVSLADPV